MDEFDLKLKELIEIIELENKKMKKNIQFFSDDEPYKKVLKKYSAFLTCLEQKDQKQIRNFLEEIINELMGYIGKCGNPDNIISTFEVANDQNVPEINDAYELNEYFNIVFYIYNLFLEKDFNRSDSIKYQFSIANLDKISENINNKIERN